MKTVQSTREILKDAVSSFQTRSSAGPRPCRSLSRSPSPRLLSLQDASSRGLGQRQGHHGRGAAVLSPWDVEDEQRPL